MKERRLFRMPGLDFGSRMVGSVGGMAVMAVGRPCDCSMRRRVSPAGVTSMVGERRRMV
jgi:hypothetical protein